MVGAQLIGELAWSVENLLNRIINRTLPQTPSVLDLVDEVCAALPPLVEQLETGSAPTVRVSELIDRANALTEGGRHPLTTKAGGVAALERTLVLPRTPSSRPRSMRCSSTARRMSTPHRPSKSRSLRSTTARASRSGTKSSPKARSTRPRTRRRWTRPPRRRRSRSRAPAHLP
jgi:hypothetical protein